VGHQRIGQGHQVDLHATQLERLSKVEAVAQAAVERPGELPRSIVADLADHAHDVVDPPVELIGQLLRVAGVEHNALGPLGQGAEQPGDRRGRHRPAGPRRPRLDQHQLAARQAVAGEVDDLGLVVEEVVRQLARRRRRDHLHLVPPARLAAVGEFLADQLRLLVQLQ